MNKMKIYKALFTLIVMAFLAISCEDFLDLKPYDALTAEQLLKDEAGMQGMLDGSLRMIKDGLESSDYGGNNVYVRVLFQTTEFPSDNVLIVKPTTDPLWYSFNRSHTLAQENVGYFWSTAYKVILNSNQVIEAAEIIGSSTDTYKQMVGEAYFYRGMAFFDLARLFSFPPSHGLNNKGVILRTALDQPDAMPRATVGETYEQIINDLKTGASLMTERAVDRNKYGNVYAAKGYLSRAFLFTEEYDSVISYANQLLDGNSPFILEPRESYVSATQNTASSQEAMFIIYHGNTEDRSTGAIGSMYNGDGGWGEVFPSEPFYNLITKYPNDVRNDFIIDTIGENYQGTLYEKIYMTKFSYQNGIASLHSPIFMRLSEVLLNRAEAYAHLGKDQLALDDVNTIRARAGLSGDELMTIANLTSTHGYNNVLEAVLAERRLELAFEGHRRDDLMRNKIDLDRSYPSAQNPDNTSDIYPYDGDRQIYFIPEDKERIYNPLCEQND